jgi:hypothetical protein
LQLLAFDEYCRFDTSALFGNIKREPRFIFQNKAEVSKVDYSSKANSWNVREGGGKLSNPRALHEADAWRKITEIYGNPRAQDRAHYAAILRYL